MEKVIQGIAAVSGVQNCILANNNGEVLISAGMTNRSSSALSQLSLDLVQIFGSYELTRQVISEFNIHFEEGNVFVQARENFLLIILHQNIASLSMIRLTANVALAELEHNKKVQKLLKDSNSRWNMLRRDSLRMNELALWEIIRK